MSSETLASLRARGFPAKVRVVEVGPRDGLQNEPERIALPDKLRYARLLDAAGFQTLEVGSFVRADVIPQLADTDRLIAALDNPKADLITLVPNQRGLDRALDSGVKAVAVFTAASDAFTLANIGTTVADSLLRCRDVAKRARAEGLSVRGYISTCWWCPFSGAIAPALVLDIAKELMDAGCQELAISDTVGVATPLEVGALVDRLKDVVPVAQMGVHLHDTRGTALASVLMALQQGVSIVDAAAGGLGGCPFAPGAAGNLATEDLVFMLDGMGIETGIDLEALCEASRFMESVLGRPLPSRYLRAGPFEAQAKT